MKHSLPFYIAGGLLGLMLLGYSAYLVNFMASKISVASNTSLLSVPDIATYNFTKFSQVKGAQK